MRNRKAGLMMAVFTALMLAALACTCGPLSQAQQTMGTAQAVASEVGESLPTINAALTEMGPTFEAMASQGPTFEAQMTEMVATANAAGQDVGPTLTALAGQGVGFPQNVNGQWAVSATASSEYGSDSWSASQAAGPPNTTACGDYTSAWASGSPTEIATLTLTYANPVVPQQINIFETYNPDFVSLVEVVEPNGTRHTVYTGQPAVRGEGAACPYILTINVTDVNVTVNQVIVTVDQTNAPSWNEIDAVELVGTPQ